MSEKNPWQEYIQNIHRAEELQEEMIREAKAGEDPCKLLLKCARALSLTTANPVFYEQLERSVLAIHGSALGEPAALEADLEQTRARMEAIRSAQEQETDPVLREEMGLAIRAHRERIERLTAQLAKK